MEPERLRAKVRDMMPEVIADLARLVSHASIAFPGRPAEPVLAAAQEAVSMLKSAGLADARLLDVPGGYPAVWASSPAPAGAPTALLYAHYDVQPAPPEQGWATDPWTLTEGDGGRLYGRGAADNKSGVVIHAGALRTFEGRFPVGIKVVLEGEEETVSHLEAFVDSQPDLFAADLMIVADMGNLVAGEPVLTTTLRGDVHCTVEVRTIESALHSGLFGGPAPDALVALIKLLSALWDDRGNTVVPGLRSYDWLGAEMPEDLYREQAGMLAGVETIGDGSVSTRLWSSPNVTVTGLDAPRTENASNILIPSAKAHLSLRIAPDQDEKAALDALVRHLRDHAPWGVELDVVPIAASPAFEVATDGPGFAAARVAVSDAYGKPAGEAGSGGSIPLLTTLRRAAPGAEFVLWGAEDVARSRIHGGNESVDPKEIESLIVAEALLMRAMG
jgi:acetylornithine deacetylase/succinyl-diaminopimelate desuccinylase-like protein